MGGQGSLSPKEIQGRLTGGAIMFGFGIFWIAIGLSGGRFSPAWMRVGLVAAGVALATWLVALMIRFRRSHQGTPPPTPEEEALDRQAGQRFGRINGFQWGAIVAAIIVLNVIHRTGFIAPVIAIIVGIHFFPLAPLFRQPFYYATGAAGCLIGIAGFVIADVALRLSAVGISFGLLLWVTVAVVLGKIVGAQAGVVRSR